jgi:hypothetical protein
MINPRGICLDRCGDGSQGDIMLLERLPAAIRALAISPLID